MDNQLENASFRLPTQLISGFIYPLNHLDRVDLKLSPVTNIDSGEVSPNIFGFGNGGNVHKAIVTIGTRDFLLYGWNVQEGQGVPRNQSLAKIRPSTLYFGEVLVFVKGATEQVPFLKNPLSILKHTVEEAVGEFITGVLNAQDGHREVPNRFVQTL